MTSQINGLKKKVCDQAFVFEHRASKRELNIADGKKMRFWGCHWTDYFDSYETNKFAFLLIKIFRTGFNWPTIWIVFSFFLCRLCSFIDSQGQSHLEKGRCPMHVKVWRFKNHKINRVKSGILWINIKFEVLFVIEQQVLLRCYWTRNFSSVLRYYSVFPFYLLVLSIKCHEVICKVLAGVVISPSREEPGTWNLPYVSQSILQ